MGTYGKLSKPTTSLISIGLGLGSPGRRCLVIKRNNMDALINLSRRLRNIGIEIELAGNYPWIYIEKVNGNRIKKEDFFFANHGFTVSFLPNKLGKKMEIIDIKKTFEIIRKYI